MDKREKELSELKSYSDEIDKDLTMILQTLQWDRQHLLQGKPLVKCKYDSGHRIPEEIKDQHELDCFLKQHGYMEEAMLPEPLDPNANTIVKLSDKDITTIINIAAASDPSFRRGVGCQGPQPLTLERLQATYTVDERRAIHNAVVSKAPASQDFMDLTLPSGEEQQTSKETKSRLEILSEMRDMKRRPVKYRVASKTRNYSDVLRGVINTQMEMYTGVKSEPSSSIQDSRTSMPMNIKQEPQEDHNSYNELDRSISDRDAQRGSRYEHRHTRETRTEETRHRKRESEERRDRHNYRRSEYSNSKHDSDRRRHKEKERVRSRSKERRHSNESYRHKDRRRYEERSSRDRRTDDRHLDKRDKYRSNGSHSYADVKVKEEKLTRYYDGYNGYDN